MKQHQQYTHQIGQTLVVLLVFMVMAITIASTAVTVIISNSQNASKLELGDHAFEIAESGAENALIRLLRNPNYTGETLTIGSGSATVTVTGTNILTVLSKGTLGNFVRKVQIIVNYTNGAFSINSWQEVF